MASRFHVGDVGGVLRFTVKESGSAVDISSATSPQIEIQRPDGTTLDKTAVFTTDGTDGQIEYAFIADDLDTPGIYEAQGYMVLGSWTGRTTKTKFEVYGNAI